MNLGFMERMDAMLFHYLHVTSNERSLCLMDCV